MKELMIAFAVSTPIVMLVLYLVPLIASNSVRGANEFWIFIHKETWWIYPLALAVGIIIYYTVVLIS